MLTTHISVTGIRPDVQSVGPLGNHLRWAFPSQVGFPARGFAVYRRSSVSIQTSACLNFTNAQVQAGEIVTSGSSLQGVGFLYSGPSQIKGNGSKLTVDPPGSGLLDLRFAQPMVYVKLHVREIIDTIQLRAYAGQHLVATSQELNPSDRYGYLEVTAPFITRVTIPLRFTSLLEVCHRSLAVECSDNSWGTEPIVRLPLPQAVDAMLKRLQVDGLFNRYVSDAGAAIQKYEPQLVDLLDWLQRLQKPASTTPDQLQLSAPDRQHPLQSIRPQSILLLATLDPNIARLLSLFWVDADSASNGPMPGEAYDYKVEGIWQGNQTVSCGLVLGLGANTASLPQVHGPLRGDQLPGLRFQRKEPLGRVGLRWPQPQQGQEAVQPVLFDIARRSDSSAEVSLTEAMPVLVPASEWDGTDTALFIDTDVALGKQFYRLRPIDLFGQVGDWIDAEQIEVQDLEAPPPPVRLRVTAIQPGYPWRTDQQKNEPEKTNIDVDLRFEFGGAQHRQAPDASSFQLYYRTESLFERQAVNAVIQATGELPNDLKVYTVQISGAPGIDLSHFAGGILARRSADETALPADQRLRFRIGEVLSSNSLKLAPTEETFTGGSYELISDPHLRATWHPWGLPVPVHPELESPLKVEKTFHARAAGVEVLGSSPNPLALLPAAHQPQSLADPPGHVEVLLDIELLEPDLFTGGTLQVGTHEFSIIYSTSGPAYKGQNEKIAARLGLPPGSVVAPEDSLTLKPDKDALVRVLWLEATDSSALQKTPGGEVAFDVVANESGETLTYVARVMSAIRPEDARHFSVLVRLLSPAALTALDIGVQQVRYYAPYRVTLQAALGPTPTAGALPLPLPDGQSSQNLYLALTTSDPRKNESPLSAPAQVTAVKPPPTGAPGRPYACGQSATDAAGYATPPDRQGRATLCLKWDEGTLSQTNGLRYEVARALDTTILTTHRRNWLQGQIEIKSPVTGGIQLGGTLANITFDPKRGLYAANMTGGNLGALAPAQFRGGRLTQSDGQSKKHHFQVTAIAVGDNGALEVVLRPMAQVPPAQGDATLYTPPDYSDVRNDPAALRELAAKNPDAFGLVTGVPIRETQFRDEIPGIGRNCYFYRVRAVDSAENHSAWSDVSMPFYQVDTSPPDVPQRFGVVAGHRTAELVWLPSHEPGIVGYHVYRAEGDEPPKFQSATTTFHATVSLVDIAPRPLRVVGRRLILPAALSDPDPTTVEVRPLSAKSDAPNLFAHAADLTRLENRRVRHLNPLVSDGTPVRVAVGNAATSRTLTHRPGSGEPLVVQDHIVNLTFGLNVKAIEVLLLAGQIADDNDLETLLARPSLLQEDKITADVDALTIGGLEDVLPDGIAVAVVVRLADDSLRVLRNEPGTSNALTVANGKVGLDLDIPDDSLQVVHALSGVYAAGPLGREASDLRVMQASQIVREGSDGPVTAVAHLNPLVPDGLAVRMTLRTTTGDEHSLIGDPSQWSWIDTHLQGDQVYWYGLAARKWVVFAPAPTGGSAQERELISSVAGPTLFRTLALPVPYEEEEG